MSPRTSPIRVSAAMIPSSPLEMTGIMAGGGLGFGGVKKGGVGGDLGLWSGKKWLALGRRLDREPAKVWELLQGSRKLQARRRRESRILFPPAGFAGDLTARQRRRNPGVARSAPGFSVRFPSGL